MCYHVLTSLVFLFDLQYFSNLQLLILYIGFLMFAGAYSVHICERSYWVDSSAHYIDPNEDTASYNQVMVCITSRAMPPAVTLIFIYVYIFQHIHTAIISAALSFNSIIRLSMSIAYTVITEIFLVSQPSLTLHCIRLFCFFMFCRVRPAPRRP
jgi:hypothetical protein